MWRGRLRKNAPTERGQTLVVVGVMLMALVGLAALSLDVGEILWSRGTQQNIADSAALAGIRALPGDPLAAPPLAEAYARLNHPTGEPVTVSAAVASVRYPNDAVVVDVQRTSQPWLRSAVGGGPINVPARAVAIVTSVDLPPNPCNVWPWGIDEYVQPVGSSSLVHYTATYGQMIALKVDPGNQHSPGNFGALALAGGGAENYRTAIENGGVCVSGTSIPVETGNMPGPTRQGVDNLLEAVNGPRSNWPAVCATPGVECTNGVPDNVHWQVPPPNYPWGLGCPCGNNCGCTGPVPGNPRPVVQVGSCGRVGYVPITDGTWPNGSTGNVNIVDWAAFYLIGTMNHGGDLAVVGVFLGYVGDPQGDASWGDPGNSPIVNYYLWE